jgi:hypothetical protein
MVKVREDLTGRVFGRLTVLEQAEDYIDPKSNKPVARWLCECSCEEHKVLIVRGNALRTGHTTSCGCYNKERSFEANKKYNKYDLSGEYGIGWTTNTNREFYFDLEDYDKIKDYCWCEYLVQKRYSTLRTNKDGKYINMHQLLGFKNYDHIDRNELNNRKNNLRECTERQNHMNRSLNRNNTSGVSGVAWDKSNSCWRAQIGINKKYIKLGSFIEKRDAIICRLKAEVEYYGEFAPQKHLFEEYGITIQNDYEVAI